MNLFVGANNSGKSRLIRSIASRSKLVYKPQFNLEEIQKLKNDLTNVIMETASKNSLSSIEQILLANGNTTINRLESTDWIEEGQGILTDVLSLLTRLYNRNKRPLSYGLEGSMDVKSDELATKIFQNALMNNKAQFEDYQSQYSTYAKDFKRLYIPTLRGLRNLQVQSENSISFQDFLHELGDWLVKTKVMENKPSPQNSIKIDPGDLYQKRTYSDYPSIQNVEVFTGQQLYEHVKSLLLGSLEKRQIISDFQDFLSRTFFNNEKIALIPREDRDVLVIKIGSRDEYEVYNLGDGIQQIIAITFPLFEYRSKHLLVFIEEPEMHLHPNLQRILLNAFITEEAFENHQFFATTHSNHFLDLTLDQKCISIFTCKELFDSNTSNTTKPKFQIENVSNDDFTPLELLGVRNSSVLLSNCTIWVEGITDRKYLSHYLKLYMSKLDNDKALSKRFKEDLHFSFVEYSGGNITHWSFLDEENGVNAERLCGNFS